MIVEVPHPKRGTFTTVGCPLKLSDAPIDTKASPLLSEHTDEVLQDVMDYSPEEVAQLRDSVVV